MKKLSIFIAIAFSIGVVACGSGKQEKAAASEETAAQVDEMVEETTEEEVVEEAEASELAEHVCDEKCHAEGCTGPRCGEKGHTCTDACKAKAEGEETHSHEEGHEGHSH